MITSFADGYPNELIYSMIARHIEQRKYRHITNAYLNLFDTTDVKAVVDLPSRLGFLIGQLPRGHVYTSEQLLNQHTTLPYHSRFLPSVRLTQIKSQLRGNRGQDVHLKL